MKERYYSVIWSSVDKERRVRYYTREYKERQKAIEQARLVKARCTTAGVKIRECESWDVGEVTHVSLLGYVEF